MSDRILDVVHFCATGSQEWMCGGNTIQLAKGNLTITPRKLGGEIPADIQTPWILHLYPTQKYRDCEVCPVVVNSQYLVDTPSVPILNAIAEQGAQGSDECGLINGTFLPVSIKGTLELWGTQTPEFISLMSTKIYKDMPIIRNPHPGHAYTSNGSDVAIYLGKYYTMAGDERSRTGNQYYIRRLTQTGARKYFLVLPRKAFSAKHSADQLTAALDSTVYQPDNATDKFRPTADLGYVGVSPVNIIDAIQDTILDRDRSSNLGYSITKYAHLLNLSDEEGYIHPAIRPFILGSTP